MADVQGHVKDATTKQALPFVNVAVFGIDGKPNGHGTITDANGFWSLTDIGSGNSVQFSFVGYQKTIPLLRAYPVNNEILLQPISTDLPTATATAKPTYTRYWVALAVLLIILFIYYKL